MPEDDSDRFPWPSEVAKSKFTKLNHSAQHEPEHERYHALLLAMDRLAELVICQQPGFEVRVQRRIAERRKAAMIKGSK